MWVNVIPHFQRFLSELDLTPDQRSDADDKADRIARSLWRKYWQPISGEFSPRCYLKVGSYGKGTAIRPPSDLDMLFLLPADEYTRINARLGNRQSYLLGEIKETLGETFPLTDLSADGQVVLAPFESYSVEVVPAFNWDDKSYITAHTADGGNWRFSNPAEEYRLIKYVDSQSDGKATHLIRMLKAWKRECSVELKSISLEVLACGFVEQWPNRLRNLYWYDWMIRDFFEFALRYVSGGWTKVPGTQETIQLGYESFTKCKSAYDRALEACEYEYVDKEYEAAKEWQKIFGQQFHCRPRLALAIAMAAR